MDIQIASKYLIDFLEDLLAQGKISAITEIEIKYRMRDEYSFDLSEEDLTEIKNKKASKKINFNKLAYSVVIQFNIEDNSYKYISTEEHDDLFKCVKEAELRINNEISIYSSFKNFKKKIENVSFDELKFLESELQDALEKEDYEKANKLKKKIAELKNNKKKK